ncbi:MAG: hypothetical protein WAL15_10835, partial [Xanthobacteraceae bacterium]
MDTYQPAPNLSLLPDSLGSHVQELTSAVDLMFLSFLRRAHQRNLKSKTARARPAKVVTGFASGRALTIG